MDRMLPEITAALPLLVHLSVDLPDRFRTGFDSALLHPAPRLISYSIFRPLQRAPRAATLSFDLFAGAAPRLRYLTLTNVTFPEKPAAILRSISRAHLRYWKMLPDETIRRHLPNLNHLRLTLFLSAGHAVKSLRPFNLGTLALCSLVIEEGAGTLLLDALERSTDLSVIPVVQVVGNTIRWSDPLWTRDAANVYMRICVCTQRQGGLCVLIAPEHMLWRRLFRIVFWYALAPLPIDGMPNLATRLAYLRLGASNVLGCLVLRLIFTALRELHIDVQANGYDALVIAPPDYDRFPSITSFRQLAAPEPRPIAWMPCPALEGITLFASDEPIPHAYSRRVAFLAHALGQLGRPAADKAVLVLFGIEFQEPVARAMLDETVSAIIERPFAGRGSREDYEGGLWEHEC
ncbi:hypothetical protein AURDEDRAFT_163704 [Auricularia subglabra TFB-10046 SS5]|nr:hypothetical protein AURDEDRAFT_163704 [Auricularia subglabra TFB-10046 SS5]